MLWFDRVGIGLAILLTAGTGLLFYETRTAALANRAEITAANAECSHAKSYSPNSGGARIVLATWWTRPRLNTMPRTS
jgi:hypothetical protein